MKTIRRKLSLWYCLFFAWVLSKRPHYVIGVIAIDSADFLADIKKGNVCGQVYHIPLYKKEDIHGVLFDMVVSTAEGGVASHSEYCHDNVEWRVTP